TQADSTPGEATRAYSGTAPGSCRAGGPRLESRLARILTRSLVSGYETEKAGRGGSSMYPGRPAVFESASFIAAQKRKPGAAVTVKPASTEVSDRRSSNTGAKSERDLLGTFPISSNKQ